MQQHNPQRAIKAARQPQRLRRLLMLQPQQERLYRAVTRIRITMRPLPVQDKSRQDDALAAFQNFIKKYPDSTYQPNANYWLGRLNYNKGKRTMRRFILPPW